MADPQLLRSFRFQVKLLRSPDLELGAKSTSVPNASPSGTKLGNCAFQECSGLDIEMDVQEYQEGGRNDSTIRRFGRVKYQNLVLKRGMVWSSGGGVNREIWNWLQDALRGVRPLARYDGIVEVMGVADDVVARWVFRRGLPAKVSGPQLNAKTGEVAIEELQIAHEGLRLETL